MAEILYSLHLFMLALSLNVRKIMKALSHFPRHIKCAASWPSSTA